MTDDPAASNCQCQCYQWNGNQSLIKSGNERRVIQQATALALLYRPTTSRWLD